MTQIFESPDGGKTIYSRLPHQPTRTLVKDDLDRQRMSRWHSWGAILAEAETNPTLNELVYKAEMVYALIKK